MNIFAIDQDPTKAAQQQCNKHVVKMSSETANLLLWPFKYLGLTMPNSKQGSPLKLSHENHPSSIWVRKSKANYDWTLIHLEALCAEYSKRYNNKHYAETYLVFCKEHYSKLSFGGLDLTSFARCFSKYKEELEQEEDDIAAYRKFYVLDKQNFAKWPSKDKIPTWWPFEHEKFLDPSFKDGIYLKRKKS